MKIIIVTPAAPGSKKGNRITALRWRKILQNLGHQVVLLHDYKGQTGDLMIALHARRSFEAIAHSAEHIPHQKLIIALTGTDLYHDIHYDANAQQALQWADRLIVLQAKGIEELPQNCHSKTRTIYQSISPQQAQFVPSKRFFTVAVVGHLREVKDPFRTAEAVRDLPPHSCIRVWHIGKALTEGMHHRALGEMKSNHRYHWLGELPHWRTRQKIAQSHLLAHTSQMEGGANVVSEAMVASVPVIASRISGCIGMLGESYPGFFPYGDTDQLQKLLLQMESDALFYQKLQQHCIGLQKNYEPSQEQLSWKNLLAELF